MDNKNNIGLIGLAVMGANLARNFADKGYKIAVFNRTFAKTEEFLNQNYNNIIGYEKINEFINSLERPRKVILMVKSGTAVDDFIAVIKEHLEEGDIIIDCGNSHWKDTQRRQLELASDHIDFVGCGVSGGEEGALHGPSIMPGGRVESIKTLLPMLNAIAAKDFEGNACVTNVGLSGSGHFVKMVHNGIEYAIMQGIAEVYDILRNVYKNGENYDHVIVNQIFEGLNTGDVQSFLMDVSINVLKSVDEKTGKHLVDLVVDKAGSKGTGKWTVESALDLGIAVPTISASLFARILSSRNTNVMVKKNIEGQLHKLQINKEDLQSLLYTTLESVYLAAYLQGLDLIIAANTEFDWQIDLGEVIRIWQGGCIIRSQMLSKLTSYLREEIDFENRIINLSQVSKLLDLPLPVINSTLDYIRTLSASKLPTNLIQGQRDYFGAHTYERVDMEGVFSGGWNIN